VAAAIFHRLTAGAAMFWHHSKSIYQRVQARPFANSEPPPFEVFSKIVPRPVRVTDLIPTQEFLVINLLYDLTHGAETRRGDPYPHIVDYQRRLLIFDGHHRWVLASLRGSRLMMARVWKHSRHEESSQ
jgi:hypothetical protein